MLNCFLAIHTGRGRKQVK